VARIGEGRNMCRILVGNLEGENHLADHGVEGRMGSKRALRESGWWGGGVEWIHLAQDRDRLRALVNAVMNIQVLSPWS
jgi:hypothetical protein